MLAGEKYADSIRTFFVLLSQAVFFPPRIPAKLITPLSSQITVMPSSSLYCSSSNPKNFSPFFECLISKFPSILS